MVLCLGFQIRSDFADLLKGYELHRPTVEGVPITINLSEITSKLHTLTLFVIIFK